MAPQNTRWGPTSAETRKLLKGFVGYTVFISHPTKDRVIAQQVAGLIQEAGGERGIETFLDEKNIEFGGSIP